MRWGCLGVAWLCYILDVEWIWGGVWYVFGGKTVVACKSALFNILDLVWYLSWNSLMMSMRVLVRSWIWGRAVMLKEESFLKEFLCIGFLLWVRGGKMGFCTILPIAGSC